MPDPTPTPSPAAQPPKPQDDTIKETFESIVIAFILAFVFRAYVVEAFVIPTGSMAPTLLGEHVRVTCEQCGYHYKVDAPGEKITRGRSEIPFVHNRQLQFDIDNIHCPMCQFSNVVPAGAYVSSGDRILVHKYLYSINEPQRWDVVVFKAPHKPQTNYIKRLIGLPNQETMILDGNVYYNATPEKVEGWKIARKTDPKENPHAEKIQRTVWQPVYHSQYVPLDYDPADSRNRWQTPWVISTEGGAESAPWKRGTGGNEAELDATRGFTFDSAGKGAVRFDFSRVFNDHSAGFFPYGQRGLFGQRTNNEHYYIPVEDLRLAAAIEPKQDGLRVTLRTHARLDDKAGDTHALFAVIDAQGNATLWRSDSKEPLASQNIGAFKAGATRLLELWYVDQEASLWVDGGRVLMHRFDGLTYDELRSRAGPFESFEGGEAGPIAAEHRTRRRDLRVPVVKVEVEGSPVVIHHVDLDRDLYYWANGKGTVSSQGVGKPVLLKPDEFFCLGDNSPFSLDSRAWNTVDPWVYKRSFTSDTTEEESHGVVPRRIMMGKAFFVYFPTMIGRSAKEYPYFPNFGEMRFIH